MIHRFAQPEVLSEAEGTNNEPKAEQYKLSYLRI